MSYEKNVILQMVDNQFVSYYAPPTRLPCESFIVYRVGFGVGEAIICDLAA